MKIKNLQIFILLAAIFLISVVSCKTHNDTVAKLTEQYTNKIDSLDSCINILEVKLDSLISTYSNKLDSAQVEIELRDSILLNFSILLEEQESKISTLTETNRNLQNTINHQNVMIKNLSTKK